MIARLIFSLLVFGLLAACAQDQRDSRSVGNVFDPLCMPDGSPVYTQYSDTEGEFDTTLASRENCPWNQE